MNMESHGGMSADEAGIRAAYATWFAAMESGNVTDGLSVVTPDIFHRGPSGEARVGIEALGEALCAFHAAYAERVRWELVSLSVRDDAADAIVREDAIVRPRAGGESVRVVGLHDSRLRRDETGTWRIARDVSTLDGPPTPLAVHRFDLRGG